MAEDAALIVSYDSLSLANQEPCQPMGGQAQPLSLGLHSCSLMGIILENQWLHPVRVSSPGTFSFFFIPLLSAHCRTCIKSKAEGAQQHLVPAPVLWQGRTKVKSVQIHREMVHSALHLKPLCFQLCTRWKKGTLNW